LPEFQSFPSGGVSGKACKVAIVEAHLFEDRFDHCCRSTRKTLSRFRSILIAVMHLPLGDRHGTHNPRDRGTKVTLKLPNNALHCAVNIAVASAQLTENLKLLSFFEVFTNRLIVLQRGAQSLSAA